MFDKIYKYQSHPSLLEKALDVAWISMNNSFFKITIAKVFIIRLFYQLHSLISPESTIMLRESSQGESSVMRLRLEGHKKPIRGRKKSTTNTH